jgi:hypothetical protein
MSRPVRRKPATIKIRTRECGEEHLAVTLEIPEEMVLEALKQQIAAKLPKKMKAFPEQPVELMVLDVEVNIVLVRAFTRRPRALEEGTTDEVQRSIINSVPVIWPEPKHDDDAPF